MKTERTITLQKCDNSTMTGVIVNRAYKSDSGYIATKSKYYVNLTISTIDRLQSVMRYASDLRMTVYPLVYSNEIAIQCIDNDWREVK